MGLDLLIRDVRLEDAEAILRFLNPIIEAGRYTVLDTPFDLDTERAFIANFPRRGFFHVAERRSDGCIVGFESVEPFASYTHAFDHVATMGTFVHLDERRKGIGTQLALATFETAPCRGFEKIFTYVRADNESSLAFHRSLGFEVVGTARRQAKFGGTYVDEIMIEKFL